MQFVKRKTCSSESLKTDYLFNDLGPQLDQKELNRETEAWNADKIMWQKLRDSAVGIVQYLPSLQLNPGLISSTSKFHYES